MTEEDATVSYSVRDLLARIDERLVRIDERLDTKADRHELENLATKVDRLETVRDRMIGAAVVLAVGGGGIGSLVTHLLG